MALNGSISTIHVFTTAGRWKNATKKLTKEQTNKTMNLHLTVTKKWFDLIKSGEKKEEYREIKMYWATRLTGGFPSTFGIDLVMPDFKDFEYVIFRNGYSKDSQQIIREFKRTRIGEGRPEWGAEPGKKYYIIELN